MSHPIFNMQNEIKRLVGIAENRKNIPFEHQNRIQMEIERAQKAIFKNDWNEFDRATRVVRQILEV